MTIGRIRACVFYDRTSTAHPKKRKPSIIQMVRGADELRLPTIGIRALRKPRPPRGDEDAMPETNTTLFNRVRARSRVKNDQAALFEMEIAKALLNFQVLAAPARLSGAHSGKASRRGDTSDFIRLLSENRRIARPVSEQENSRAA
jgi:hypothetical protein